MIIQLATFFSLNMFKRHLFHKKINLVINSFTMNTVRLI